MSNKGNLKKQEMFNLSLAPKFTISFWWGLLMAHLVCAPGLFILIRPSVFSNVYYKTAFKACNYKITQTIFTTTTQKQHPVDA